MVKSNVERGDEKMIKESKIFEFHVSKNELEIIPVGEIDHHSAVEIRKKADELIKEHKSRKVVLNLCKITFMDSSGLGFIMGRYALAEKLGLLFAIRNPTPAVIKICKLAGLDRKIKFEEK